MTSFDRPPWDPRAKPADPAPGRRLPSWVVQQSRSGNGAVGRAPWSGDEPLPPSQGDAAALPRPRGDLPRRRPTSIPPFDPRQTAVAADALRERIAAEHVASAGAAQVSPPTAPPPEPEYIVDPEATEQVLQAAAALVRARAEFFEDTCSQAAELAWVIARRVVGQEVSVNPRAVQSLVREGLEIMGRKDRLAVKVGSGFGALLDELRDELSSDGVTVEVDRNLALYGCVVASDLGRVDVGVETRLDLMSRGLFGGGGE